MDSDVLGTNHGTNWASFFINNSPSNTLLKPTHTSLLFVVPLQLYTPRSSLTRHALSDGNNASNSCGDNNGLPSARSIAMYPAAQLSIAACWVDANDSGDRPAYFNRASPVSGVA
jgi:hypothetical protein